MLRGLLSVSLVLAQLAAPALAAFGVTTSGNSLIVDTAGGLVFTGAFLSFDQHSERWVNHIC